MIRKLLERTLQIEDKFTFSAASQLRRPEERVEVAARLEPIGMNTRQIKVRLVG